MSARKIRGADRGSYRAVDVQDRGRGILEERRGRAMQCAHLIQELAHVLRARARGRLVSHGADPFDQTFPHQAAHRHQHQRNRAIPANEILDARLAGRLHHRKVDRIEDDHRRVGHSQGGRGVDPIALPSGLAETRMNGLGVVSALSADEHGQALERSEVMRILNRRVDRAADIRRGGARLRRAEEDGLDQVEIPLGAHALEQH